MAPRRLPVVLAVALFVVTTIWPAPLPTPVARAALLQLAGTAPSVARVNSVSAGATTRASVDSSGAQANGESAYSDISADGRYVVFESRASNLVAGDTNSKWDIFLFDRQTAQTSRLSVSTSGVQGNADSRYPRISGDGSSVTFQPMRRTSSTATPTSRPTSSSAMSRLVSPHGS